MSTVRRRLSLLLLLLLSQSAVCGCGAPSMPPGGAAAVEYWHRVLAEYPDLPARVRAIVEDRGQSGYDYGLPSTQVRIYGEQGEVALSGSRIELIVTDLDTPALEELLKCWESIGEQAAELGLPPWVPTPYLGGRRVVVVLGSEGRVDVAGIGGQDHQSIRILSDEVAKCTTIGIHTFGTSGQRALDELARNYHSVRGPPHSEVRSGHVSLPPPDETLHVLVVGKLQQLNIGGAYEGGTQDISLTAFLNSHHTADHIGGVGTGSPFVDRLASNPEPVLEPALEPAGPAPSWVSETAPVAAEANQTPSGYSNPTIAAPASTPIYAPQNIQLPTPAPYTPPKFSPPLVVPTPVLPPVRPVAPPVRFR